MPTHSASQSRPRSQNCSSTCNINSRALKIRPVGDGDAGDGEKCAEVSWRAVYEQFGSGYSQFRQFKAKFKEPLALALAVYPEAHVSVDDDGLRTTVEAANGAR